MKIPDAVLGGTDGPRVTEQGRDGCQATVGCVTLCLPRWTFLGFAKYCSCFLSVLPLWHCGLYFQVVCEEWLEMGEGCCLGVA